MNAFSLNQRTITYIDDFLDELKHIHNHISVKIYVARTEYGSIVRIKIYWQMKGQWERFSNHVCRVKCQIDLDILHGTLQHYQTFLQYMYDNISDNQSESD